MVSAKKPFADNVVGYYAVRSSTSRPIRGVHRLDKGFYACTTDGTSGVRGEDGILIQVSITIREVWVYVTASADNPITTMEQYRSQLGPERCSSPL